MEKSPVLSRILSWVVAVPIGVVVVALSVANRKPIVVSLDPFRPDDPAVAVSVPLFALVLGALVLGIVLGGLTVWWRQRVFRRAARVNRREVARLENERDRLTADLAARTAAAAPADFAALPAPGASPPRHAA